MVRDPFAGDGFVFPVTKCTNERRLFLKRANEIHALLYITKHSYDETNKNYQTKIRELPKKESTFIKIELSTGNSAILPARKILQLTADGINILTRQTFIMFYGSFETYLFQLLERSYPNIGVKEDILDRSIEILRGGKWDSKFNKMSEIFGLSFKAGTLINHFSDFELNFGGKIHKNPLSFLDELAKIRHRIVHASSILEKDKLISVEMNIFHGFYGFYFLLTDFVDSLFAKRFNYPRLDVNPAEA
ncbi:MAG: hypothetical protein Q7T83_08100, partial [Thermodesulfovibrionales bacterium]|nr:hypothetical protein [Thermodesulfovibrionales bacterium]